MRNLAFLSSIELFVWKKSNVSGNGAILSNLLFGTHLHKILSGSVLQHLQTRAAEKKLNNLSVYLVREQIHIT